MDRRHQYYPLAWQFVVVLAAVLAAVAVLVQIGVLRYVYGELGIPPTAALGLLVGELAGSAVNIPVASMGSSNAPAVRRVSVYGVTYVVPVLDGPRPTVLAVNIGGAVIPTLLSVYVVGRVGVYEAALICTVLVATAVHIVAQPVEGLGIVVPPLLPPAFCAVAAELVTHGHHAAAVAFASGTLGTLIGGDLLNLHKLPRLGAPIASIGGAGTFDGVFLTGIVAVLLVSV
jgi:uncharacterized membrane protein